MSFQRGNTFVFGETPAASKWDQLWRNDDALQDWSGFDAESFDVGLLDPRSVPGSALQLGAVGPDELDPNSGFVLIDENTLSSATKTVNVSVPNRRFYRVYAHALNSGSINIRFRLNGDTGNNYGVSRAEQGGAAATGTNSDNIASTVTASNPMFLVAELTNLSSAEKILVGHYARSGGAGAGNASVLGNFSGKWANTANAVSTINIINTDTGDFVAGSRFAVYASLE